MTQHDVLEDKIASFTDTNDPVLVMQGNQFVACNDIAVTFLGFEKRDELLFTHPSEVSPEYQPDGELSYLKSERYIDQCYRVGSANFNWAHKHVKSGKLLWVNIKLQSFSHEGRDYIISCLSNISDYDYDERDVKFSTSHFLLLNEHKKAVDASSIVSKTDRKGRITYINKNFCDVSGYSPRELLGRNHNIVRHPSMSDDFFKAMWAKLKRGEVWRGVIKNRAKDGTTYYVDSTITPIKDSLGKTNEYIAIRNDITELVSQKQLVEKQNTDFVTQLPNKVKLLNELDSATDGFIAFIQLEGMSDLQMVYDHQDYDDLIKLIAERLQNYLTVSDVLYRYGDDQFVILNNQSDLSDFKAAIGNLLTKLEAKKIKLKGDELFISFVGGIAPISKDCLINGSIAVRYARQQQQRLSVFNDNTSVQQQVKELQLWANRLRKALKKGEIVPFGQNIVDREGKPVYTEVLMRLVCDGEYISPFLFLDVARKIRLYSQLSILNMSKACELLKDKSCHFSINISQSDIESQKIMRLMIDSMKKYQLGHRVTIELVESESLSFDSEELKSAITAFKQVGCKIAIDDFGSGYSNFSYLAELPIDIIKIDGSLVKNLTKNSAIIRSICGFCHSLGIEVVAEFVESRLVYEQLMSLGVDYFQGYYFDKPSILE